MGLGLFLSYNMVDGFDVKIAVSNGIFEQTSNGMMAFLRYLMALLSKHLTDRWHFEWLYFLLAKLSSETQLVA